MDPALGGKMTKSAKQLWLLAAISGAMMALGLIWAIFEGRSYQDALVWVKPVKFALSLAIYSPLWRWSRRGCLRRVLFCGARFGWRPPPFGLR